VSCSVRRFLCSSFIACLPVASAVSTGRVARWLRAGEIGNQARRRKRESRATESPSPAAAANDVAEQASAIARLVIRLALLELKQKLAAA